MGADTQTRDFVRICLFAALIAALGLLPKFDIPIAAGVPVTAQTLGVMLAGVVLGPRNGVLAVLLFVFIVALGMPLLAGGRGGLGIFFGPTGGFLLGWIPGAFAAGLTMRIVPIRNLFARTLLAAVLGGIAVVYAIGIPWLSFVAGMKLQAAGFAVLAFVPGDILKALAVAAIVKTLPPDLVHGRGPAG
ncbi:MAG: biotin transporter BioY [Hyphomicrobiales bacterium]|nr:biotin transporter BioY [Hyphomicrobiales bacterium]